MTHFPVCGCVWFLLPISFAFQQMQCCRDEERHLCDEGANVSLKYVKSKLSIWLCERGSKGTSLWCLYDNIDGNYVRLPQCAD